MRSLLLVTGCERSGTTILTSVLDTHPQIRMGNEEGPLFFISWLLDGIESGDKNKKKPWFSPVFKWKCSKEDNLRFRTILANRWIDIYKEYVGDKYKYFGDKWTEFSHHHFDFYSKQFDPIWIMIHRNKKDNLDSMKKTPWNKGVNIKKLEERYEDCTKIVLDQINNPKAFVLSYEDLCSNSENVMSRISNYLKLDSIYEFDVSSIRRK